MDILTQVADATQVTQVAYRFLVELALCELTYDDELNEVPTDYQIVDVVVNEPTEQAIFNLLKERGYLQKWGVVSYWQEQEGDEF